MKKDLKRIVNKTAVLLSTGSLFHASASSTPDAGFNKGVLTNPFKKSMKEKESGDSRGLLTWRKSLQVILFVLCIGAAAASMHAFAAERYWVGGSGNWSDDPSSTAEADYPSTTQAATGHSRAGDNHWAATSGATVYAGIVKISV